MLLTIVWNPVQFQCFLPMHLAKNIEKLFNEKYNMWILKHNFSKRQRLESRKHMWVFYGHHVVMVTVFTCYIIKVIIQKVIYNNNITDR